MLIEQLRPALILLDLSMPFIDGWSFADQYRRQNDGGRIVLLTGHPNVRDITQSLGADAYLEKPFELTQLIMTMEEQLGPSG